MRDLNALHPDVKKKAEKLIALAKSKLKLNIIVTSTVRTKEEQVALYAQGRQATDEVNILRTTAGLARITPAENKHYVTRAKDNTTTLHGYGLAFDIAVTDKTGRKINWEYEADWNDDGISDWAQVGALAEECGLEWGGNWSGMADFPHFQDRLGFTMAQIKSGKATGVKLA
jgi:peptidoglycan L-alanyl-D-glutamate endopeptidase CwlK